MNKIYTIYHIPEFVYSDGSIGKIGVSHRLKGRMKQNLWKSIEGFDNWEILEKHTDIYKVSEREIELQKEYGYKIDTVPYYKTLSMQTDEGRKKAGMKNVKTGNWRKYNVLGGKSVYNQNIGIFDPENIEKRLNSIRKKIIQYDKQGNKITEWKSISECARELNLHTSNISNVLTGVYKTTGGYIFKYKE